MPRKKVIVDTDPGLDDARALAMLLDCNEEVEVVAVTTCQGNVGIDQTSKNVVRILREWQRLDIPVFKGFALSFGNKSNTQTSYFGLDGLGDVLNDDTFDFDKYLNLQESAPEAILRIVRENVGEIYFLSLGPLTNLAKVLQMDSKFGSYLRDCVIMGGTYKGKGNVNSYAEYNFFWDPEAVDYVIKNIQIPFTLIPWQLYLNFQVPFEWYDNWLSKDTKKARFLEIIGRQTRSAPSEHAGWGFCDEIAAAVVIDASIATERINVGFHMRLEDDEGRRGELVEEEGGGGMVKVVTKYNVEALLKILEDAVRE